MPLWGHFLSNYSFSLECLPLPCLYFLCLNFPFPPLYVGQAVAAAIVVRVLDGKKELCVAPFPLSSHNKAYRNFYVGRKNPACVVGYFTWDAGFSTTHVAHCPCDLSDTLSRPRVYRCALLPYCFVVSLHCFHDKRKLSDSQNVVLWRWRLPFHPSFCPQSYKGSGACGSKFGMASTG